MQEATASTGLEPCVLVIFGATGDLTHRKLYPAVYNLYRDRLLPESFAVVSIGRREKSVEQVRRDVGESIDEFSRIKFSDAMEREKFVGMFHYLQFDFYEDEGYQVLSQFLSELDSNLNAGGRYIFYLAVAPEHFAQIAMKLQQQGLTGSSDAWRRVVIEKPFGHDLKSARQLNQSLTAAFSEREIYRIDHYLGKEMLQNLLVIRFANSLFEPLWNSRHIDHIQINLSETAGIEGRGPYYESSGALRDMVQNHMLQLLTLTAMEPPVSLDPDAIRDEKVKVLRALHPIQGEDVKARTVRGQYREGVSNGREVVGYREEDRVDPNSHTETYAALKVEIDNFRWAGVPFYLRTGKRLPVKSSEIAIQFKELPGILYFKDNSGPRANMLVIRVQPAEGVFLQFNAKRPGTKPEIIPVKMDFCQNCREGLNSPEAYERLLYDAMRGDSTLFTRWDEVEYAWRFIDEIAQGWRDWGVGTEAYPAGSWGPKGAERLLSADGRQWIDPERIDLM